MMEAISMRPLGILDGKIVNLDDNVVPMDDRGHHFGDGVYEVTKVFNGQCFGLVPHMERLFRSLRELRIPITYTFDELASFHELLIRETGITESGIYLQITRGVAPRVHYFPDKIVPRLTMFLRPGSTANVPLWETGAKIILIPDERWLRCDIKSLNLLGNVLGKQKAREAGCYEAVMVRDGQITEGTSNNFFAVKDGALWTSPLSNLILKGVIRTLLIDELAPGFGLTVIEKPFGPSFLKAADEAFLSSTLAEVMPIISVDGMPVGNGAVGPITRKLQLAYKALLAERCGCGNRVHSAHGG
jgi:D-alanine transaminase